MLSTKRLNFLSLIKIQLMLVRKLATCSATASIYLKEVIFARALIIIKYILISVVDNYNAW